MDSADVWSQRPVWAANARGTGTWVLDFGSVLGAVSHHA
jgi:hypothetical protein